MDDQRQNKTTAIPRLAKLPAQASSSKLPIPRTNSIRTSASRESLTGGSGTLRNPKLRAAPSRDQLAPGHSTSRPQAAAAPSRALSSPQTRSSLTQAPGNVSRTSKYSPVPGASRPTARAGGPPVSLASRQSSVSRQSSLSSISSGNRPLSRRQSCQQLLRTSGYNNAQEDVGLEEPQTPVTPVMPETPGRSNDEVGSATKRPPRLSLAERTIETLSQLPSSPSVKGKASAASFYDIAAGRRPPSRPGSRASRPGSSGQSDGSGPGPSRSSSRPGSSAGLNENNVNFRASMSTFRNPLSAINGTPRSRASIGPGTIRSTARPSIAAGIPRSRTPSPEKRAPDVAPSKFGARTLAARPPTKRPSINGLFRKPSMTVLGNKAPTAETPRKTSSASQRSSATSCEGTNPSSASIASGSTAITTDSSEPTPAQAYRKSSAALREQIAKAKAARKAAAREVSASNAGFPVDESPLVPTDTTFDFGLATDPFGQRRDDGSQTKILQGRLESARTSGRLNIAAMGLREIPAEVMKMYSFDSGRQDGSWAESVDLTRFVAADNELEMINDSIFPDVDPQDVVNEDDDESQGNIFAGLETLDLHGNMLIALPMGLRRLKLLTSLNLSQNRLANNCLEVISQLTSLRDLKLGGNLLYGPLDPCFSNLENLEILDLHGNNISSLPSNFGNLSRLRILNISENPFETLPFDILATLPLTELTARKNQLSGTLIQETVEALPTLQSLDVSSNQLSHLCSPTGKSVAMPALHYLCLSMNRLQALPDVSGWTSLLTLAADENSISAIPEGFASLEALKTVDFSSNEIRVVPSEIGRMENLTMLRLSGNPLREKKFSSIDTDEMKQILAQRLEPPPIHLEPVVVVPEPTTTADTTPTQTTARTGRPRTESLAPPAADVSNIPEDNMDDSRSDMDDFATPPTSAPGSPARSRSQTLTGQLWHMKPGGVLDRSNTQSSSLHPVICSKLASANKVYEVMLHHNLFTALPDSLSFFAETLTSLSLAHNQLVGETYLGGPSGNENLDLPVLKELNLASNHITSLSPLIAHLRAPKLQKLDVSCNRIAALPQGEENNQPHLRDAFPILTVLLMSNNHLPELDPDAIKGLKIVDVGNNDIAHLNPRIGLLGGTGGLERLEVGGNRFRVPRYNVLERGTEATLRWLRGRVPVAEMAGWKGDDGDDTSLADLD
ncbi:hypothetical protein QBC46DRAFT_256043 [Diplogelasinospora grovesii]|uniref:Leucine-rich repeat-containing protein 40 n=1 Tax=Diplogelasinospora grovesii TaxID=303347 RepID=A0AAN6S6X7_9PEZI|nr:hypothetical protein QBC46DRAFT_256043 [Diplogelasinospora grovesii]